MLELAKFLAFVAVAGFIVMWVIALFLAVKVDELKAREKREKFEVARRMLDLQTELMAARGVDLSGWNTLRCGFVEVPRAIGCGNGIQEGAGKP